VINPAFRFIAALFFVAFCGRLVWGADSALPTETLSPEVASGQATAAPEPHSIVLAESIKMNPCDIQHGFRRHRFWRGQAPDTIY